jgi:hypothetical protein
MLFIECDVTLEGEIALVALINAVEEEGCDPEGEVPRARPRRARPARHLPRGQPADQPVREGDRPRAEATMTAGLVGTTSGRSR